MKKWKMAVAALLVLALTAGLSACGMQKEWKQAKGAQVAMAEELEETGSEVTVVGKSSIMVTPDMAQINLGVRTTAETAKEAQELHIESMNAVRDKLIEMGIPEDSIQTMFYNIYAQYDYSMGKGELTGYTVEAQMSVKDRPVDTVGALISECVAAGANTVNGIQFTFSGYDETYEKALSQAVTVARAKADVLAQAAGLTLGEVKTLVEGYQNTSTRYDSGYYFDAEESAKASADVAVQPGQVEVTAQVTATYWMK